MLETPTPTAAVPVEITDPTNAAILAISEDRITGFLRDPFARIAEQSAAEELLSEMESLDTSSAEFATKFQKLRSEVLAHAEAEESTAFPLLEEATSLEQRQELGERYTKAKESAPTHPHPHSPDTPPGNKLLGPVAAAFDRARDAVQRA